MLSAALYEISGNKAGYTRQKGWTSIQEKEMIIAHFENFQTITRKEVMELCKCNKDHATWLLQQLRKENKIKLSGTGRNSQYVLVRVLSAFSPRLVRVLSAFCPRLRQQQWNVAYTKTTRFTSICGQLSCIRHHLPLPIETPTYD